MNDWKRAQYPTDWAEVSFSIKEACDWECMQCGRNCRQPGEPFDTWERTLTVAHYFGVYEAPEIYVAVLCKPCHFLHDCRHSWKARRRAQRLRAWMAGQLSMFPTSSQT